MSIRVTADFADGVHDAVGLVCTTDEGDDFVVLGSCFAYGLRTGFLTAAHCVGDLEAAALQVLLPGDGPRPVAMVTRHSTADVAIIRVADEHAAPATVAAIARCSTGSDVTMYGYPADIFGYEQGRPVPRVLRGHVQRVMTYASPLGFRYEATELSQPSPPGMSGGPVIAAAGVIAVATESQTSTSVLESVESRQGDGSPMLTVYQRVIEYGVGVRLDGIRPWIDRELGLPRRLRDKLRDILGR